MLVALAVMLLWFLSWRLAEWACVHVRENVDDCRARDYWLPILAHLAILLNEPPHAIWRVWYRVKGIARSLLDWPPRP